MGAYSNRSQFVISALYTDCYFYAGLIRTDSLCCHGFNLQFPFTFKQSTANDRRRWPVIA